jgi:hypothetical protein
MRALIACSIVLMGCVPEIDFDPIGSDATVAASWTIGAEAPTAERCAASGITHVRVRFFEARGEGDAAMDVFRDHPDLVFACGEGSFDTTPEAVLRGGEWRMRLLALNNTLPIGEDNVVAMGPEVTLNTGVVAGHVVLPPVDFAP